MASPMKVKVSPGVKVPPGKTSVKFKPTPSKPKRYT